MWSFTLREKILSRFSRSKRFIQFVVRHFIEDDCPYRASALAFTTLLAIVPLMSVGFAIFSAFPVFHDLGDTVEDFIFDNFVPETSKAIQSYLQLFTTQVSKLSITGVIFLFITAILVMYTIERSMNQIWRIKTQRKGVVAFLLYWAILSLAPLLLGFSLAASSYLFSIPFLQGYHQSQSALLHALPVFFSLIAFTFLYVVVPNCQVKLSHGLFGGAVAAVLFEIAKQALTYYLARYNTYELLYGAFASIPIFFMWIYWIWLISLLGAEICYALSVNSENITG